MSPTEKSEKLNESRCDGTEAQEDWVEGFLITAKESSPSQEMVIFAELREELCANFVVDLQRRLVLKLKQP